MRIGYNARLLVEPDIRGWNRYAVNLLEALVGLGVEPVLYAHRPIHDVHLARIPGATVRISPGMTYDRWEQVWFPRRAAEDRVALIHSPFNFGLPWISRLPRVLTLHDAIDRVFRAGRPRGLAAFRVDRLRDRVRHWSARTLADRVITVSGHARGDLIRHLGVDPSRVVVIPEAADPRFHRPIPPEVQAEVSTRYGLSAPYLFYVGGWELRKNLPFLLDAFAQANVPGLELVLAGGDDLHRDALKGRAETLGLADRVRLIGRVPDADLPALYAGALGFVYPSRYEGFGLQICEAMAVGCPVLASTETSLPEVLGPGGELFPVDDPGPLARLIARLAADRPFRDDLSRRARSRSLDFSWRGTAEGTLEVYRGLISS